jgi:hypothetical protein
MRYHDIRAGLMAIGLLTVYVASAAEPTGRPASESSLVGVPGASAWILQGRMAAVAAWPVFERLYTSAPGEIGRQIAHWRLRAQEAGINPTADLQRVTLIGLDATNQVLLIEGCWDEARLLSLAGRQPGFRTVTMGDVPLLVLQADRPPALPLFARFVGRRLCVGEDAAAVATVARELAKPGADLATFRAFGEGAGTGSGAMLSLLARDGQALMRLIPEAAMFAPTTGIALHARALPAQRLGVSLVARTPDAAAAANLAQMLSGLQAMAAFRAASEPQWATLAQSIRIRPDGTRVLLEFALDNALAESFLTTTLREMQRKGRL